MNPGFLRALIADAFAIALMFAVAITIISFGA